MEGNTTYSKELAIEIVQRLMEDLCLSTEIQKRERAILVIEQVVSYEIKKARHEASDETMQALIRLIHKELMW